MDPDPDPACHFLEVSDPACHFNVYPDPSFHFDADPDPDPSFQKSAQIGSYSIHFGLSSAN